MLKGNMNCISNNHEISVLFKVRVKVDFIVILSRNSTQKKREWNCSVHIKETFLKKQVQKTK